MQKTHVGDGGRLPEDIEREHFLAYRHGNTFADVLNDPSIPFDAVLAFFNDAQRQQRMEDAEIHHDRAPLAGVVRELEAVPAIGRCFRELDRRRGARLRQAIGVLVRMIMERRGWRTTGRKGSLGVPGRSDSSTPEHNKGGLSLWFVRAERYQREQGMPYRSVRELCSELEATDRNGAAGGTSSVTGSPRHEQQARSKPTSENRRRRNRS